MKLTLFTKILIFCFLTFILNCKRKNKNLTFDDYDKIEHYSTDDNNLILLSINSKRYENLNETENKYIKTLEQNLPKKLTDTSLVYELEKLNFRKEIVKKPKLDLIREIFSTEFCNSMQQNACIPEYRDIYIFKKRNRIVGIAKICFECQIAYFINETQSWERFGECEKFIKLENLK